MIAIRMLLAVVVLAAAAGCQPGEPETRGPGRTAEAATLVLHGGRIVTMDPDRPEAEAMAIGGARILAVGSTDAIASYRGPETEVIDLQGATAMPGLIDGHLHFPRMGAKLRQLFLDETRSASEVVEVVRREADRTAPGAWIVGHGWHTVTWDRPEYPDHAALSRAAPDHPVFLIGMATHAAWVNARALELAGIDRATPDPPGGQIVRDPTTGEPTGILLETAQQLVSRLLPPETDETRRADLRAASAAALRLGLTTVHDGGLDDDSIRLLRSMVDDGTLGVRLYVMRSVANPAALDEALATPPLIGHGDGRLTVRTLKVFADGALGARGAALLEPYNDAPGERGLVQNDEEALFEIVRRAGEAGYQVAIHAIGDRGNRIALNAIERAQKALPGRDLRPRIEHAQVLAREDIPRFGALGVIASMQPIHCTMDMGFTEPRVGPARARGAYAFRSLLDSNARVAAGSDTPAFPIDYNNPMWGIHAAVTRQDRAGEPPGGWYPDERVSVLEALRMFTLGAAYAAIEENEKGSLTPGKLADVTVLSRDILTIPAGEIPQVEAVMTIVGGRVVYRRPGGGVLSLEF
jgi:predicted amidohydrolase YtcJ